MAVADCYSVIVTDLALEKVYVLSHVLRVSSLRQRFFLMLEKLK